jgi:hypothetical protein
MSVLVVKAVPQVATPALRPAQAVVTAMASKGPSTKAGCVPAASASRASQSPNNTPAPCAGAAEAPESDGLDHDPACGPGCRRPSQAHRDPGRLAALQAHVRAFARMMTGRRGRGLESWMAAATASGLPELRPIVTGLRRDQDAVTAGLTLRWSSGAVGGHINRIKMLKRQMYGRANPNGVKLS